MRTQKAVYVTVAVVVALVTRAVAKCESSGDESVRKDHKLVMIKYKVGSIAAILGTGAMGVALPLLGTKTRVAALNPDNDMFFMVKAFAGGVILATAYIHIFPEAFMSLSSPCLPDRPWQTFPFMGFIAMLTTIGTLTVECLSTAHSISRAQAVLNLAAKEDGKVVDEETGGRGHGHLHLHKHATQGEPFNKLDHTTQQEVTHLQLINHRITAKVLELGIVVHSVIIGITLGTTQSLDIVKPLMAALCFHQFFEGMGLGGCISQAKLKAKAMTIMVLFFSLTTPIGVAIGIAISGRYDDNSPKSLALQGIFESGAAGILFYMAVSLLAANFKNPKLQANLMVHLGSYVSLLLGAGSMSVLAIWA